MRCCDSGHGARRWRELGGFAGSGALWLLLPKCPACVAMYVAVWTGAGVAASVAARLRPAVECLFAMSVVLLAVRCVRFLSQRRGAR